MKASFIIGFHTQRFDNLLQTLRFLIRDHIGVAARSQLVTICQDNVSPETISQASIVSHRPPDPIKHFEELCSKFGQWDHHDLNVPCMQLPKITNFGVDKAVADKLIILESDRILPKGYFSEVLFLLDDNVQITCRNMKKLTQPSIDEHIDRAMFPNVNEHRSPSNEIGMRNMWSGNTALTKAAFYKAGKMDEEYEGYGWADSDMTYRMEAIGVESVFRPEIELHLWHPAATYGSGDQKLMFINNGKRFLQKWNKPAPGWFKEEIIQYNKKRMLI